MLNLAHSNSMLRIINLSSLRFFYFKEARINGSIFKGYFSEGGVEGFRRYKVLWQADEG